MAKSIYERVRAAQAKAAATRDNPHSRGITQAQIDREELREAAIQTWHDENGWSCDPGDYHVQPTEHELRALERRLRAERAIRSAA